MAMDHSRLSGVAQGVQPETAGAAEPLALLNGHPLLSNRGIPLNLDWVKEVRVNTSAVERRSQSHVARRTVK